MIGASVSGIAEDSGVLLDWDHVPPLGRLEQVHLRSIWPDEAGDFTPWLALPENLKLLGDSLGSIIERDGGWRSCGFHGLVEQFLGPTRGHPASSR